MTSPGRPKEASLRLLREAFDRTFSEPELAETASSADVLAIRVGGDPYVIRLSEVDELRADQRLARLPSSVRALSGLVSSRGGLVPVYDLATLMGYEPPATCRWVAGIAGPKRVAIAFQTFEGHHRVPAETVPSVRGAEASGHAHGAVAVTGGLRPIIEMSSILQTITTLAGPRKSEKET
jgi:purine-binding chemotaxis protein CheW